MKLILILLPAVLAAQQPREAGRWATGDSTLHRLIAHGLEANRDLSAARSRIEAARARRTGAALELAPIVQVEGAYQRQRLASAGFPGATGAFPDQDVWSAGVLLSWELDVFGRARRLVQARGAALSSSEEDLRDLRLLVAAEIAAAYFDARGADSRLATARRNAANQRQTLGLTEDRLAAGRGNAFDTERARAQLSTTLAEIPALEAAGAAARHRLAVLLGEAPGADAVVLGNASAAAELPPPPDVGDVEAVARRRPDVRAAERRLAAARALSGSARAEYLPRLSLVGSMGYTSASAGAFGGGDTRRYAVGPMISWPALDLGRVKAGVDQARAGEHEAEAQAVQQRLRAIEEMQTGRAVYAGALERLRLLTEAAAASERAAELARERFREGADDFLQVLDAERTLLAAQDRLAAARTEAERALIVLNRALGTSW